MWPVSARPVATCVRLVPTPGDSDHAEQVEQRDGSPFPGELSLAEPGEPLGEKLGGDPEVGLLEPVERLLKEEIQHNVTSCGAYSRPQPRLVVRLLPCRVAYQRLVQSQIRAACTTSGQGSS